MRSSQRRSIKNTLVPSCALRCKQSSALFWLRLWLKLSQTSSWNLKMEPPFFAFHSLSAQF